MKKLTTKLLISVLSIALALIALGTQTFAWFSMNRTVSAKGMQVEAKAEGTIVITQTTAPTDGETATITDFADASAHELYASTHDGAAGSYTYATGLKTITNADLINPETGLARNQTELANLDYANAANVQDGKQYYFDYVVYIAGDGDSFANQNLTITVNGTYGEGGNINKAVSVDFYIAAATNGSLTNAEIVGTDGENYKGTLNVGHVKNDPNNYTTAANNNLVISSVNIPQADGNNAVAVLMRVYFDGALIEVTGNNEYTTYESATGNVVAGVYYYTDSTGAEVASVGEAGTALPSGLYKVATSNQAKTFARTNAIADIDETNLVVTFRADSAA